MPTAAAPFAILRFEKVKTMGDLASQQTHVHRYRDTPNATPNRRDLNRLLFGEHFAIKGVQKRIEEVKASGQKVRANSIPAIEVLLTASPQFFEDSPPDEVAEWVEANERFLVDSFGADNVVQVMLHMDESTPHIHAVIFPRTKDGRLSAKDILGGPPGLSEWQTRYAAAIGKGLSRGKKKSKGQHQKIAHWYGEKDLSSDLNFDAIAGAVDRRKHTPLR